MVIALFYVPYHVAFVMDGNRRFARTHHLGHVIHGHEKGFQQLAKILEWCQDLGVREVTVYAFSIENFKRSSDEVNGLMKLAEEKFAKLLVEREKLEEQQISFRFFGNIAMLSPKLRKLIAQIQLLTKDYDRGVVNVCMPYTSRDELARAFELIRKGREKGLLEEDQISEWLISRCLDSRLGTDPNMLIRTSGEKRLSDFLLWQCSTSHVYFDDVLWPEFNYWHLCKAILSYQYHCSSIQEIQRNQAAKEPSTDEQIALQPFLDYVDELHNCTLQEYASLEV
ncbi:di-trans,poly-cis-decaprenylcistransferase [Ancylostoma caninum]|uniref:Alkyl transferase n=1 Tax=Ancylostoma caninum TaxID=29170 RepID=A0A368FIS5_ANCCA|nr:di-trans,poly-cis-decaprenylcistransferase [Ancylostoma caninum]